MTSMSTRLLRIGELARLVHLSPDTLRHYERLGLVQTAGRTRGGFREYEPSVVARVRTIQAALTIGFTLGDLAMLFKERQASRPPCRKARALVDAKLISVERELARLQTLRELLRAVVDAWDRRLSRTTVGAPALLLESLTATLVELDASPTRPCRTSVRNMERKSDESATRKPSAARPDLIRHRMR